MEVVAFSILWLFALLHTVGTIGTAITVGQPRPPIPQWAAYAQLGLTVLFLYALVLLQVTR